MKDTMQDEKREQNKVVRLNAKKKKMTRLYTVLAVVVVAI